MVCGGSCAPANQACSACRLLSPVTINHTAAAILRHLGLMLTRCGGGLGALVTAIANSALLQAAVSPGNRLAVWPSSPSPSSTRSKPGAAAARRRRTRLPSRRCRLSVCDVSAQLEWQHDPAMRLPPCCRCDRDLPQEDSVHHRNKYASRASRSGGGAAVGTVDAAWCHPPGRC